MIRPLEYCCICDEPTGRAGKAEDSLYLETDEGPFCLECWEEMRCSSCNGEGKIPHCANSNGHTDYLTGFPTGLLDECQTCGGYGFRPEIFK